MKRNLYRIFKIGWINFKRNSYLSFAVTGVMSITLILLLGLITFQFLTSRAVSELQDKLDISIYFKVETPEENILSVKTDLEKNREVASVIYASRQQVLEDFRQRHQNDAKILEALEQLDDHPFEAVLNVSAVDPQNYAGVATFLENSRFREQMSTISYNRELIDRINSFTRALQASGIAVALILAVIATLITFNTIRLTIYNQKQEIEIMRLVGASNWHIRGPYMAEGFFYGIIAAAAAILVFYPVLFLISDNMLVMALNADLLRYFLINSWQIILIVFLTGIFLGIISSFIAIRKHLKV